MPLAPPLLLLGFLGLLGAAWQSGALASPAAFAAILVFATAMGFAAFLWWLAARSFALLRDPATTPAQVQALRDLPMALPEGTVRAVLALIVGVVGLPLLLFSQALSLDHAVAGYVNGIIAGVFGYYFGARSTAPDAQAARRAQDALAAEQAANAELRHAAPAPGLEEALDSLAAQSRAARVLLERIGPALPAGLVPPGAADALARAESVLRAGRAAAAGDVAAATAALAGPDGPLPALVRAAAPLLPAAAAGPVAAVAALLSAGYALGADAWRRFRARLLDAPHDPRLFEAGAVTPSAAALRLREAPTMARVLGARAGEPGFLSRLVDAALREDGAERLWTGFEGFASPDEAAAALAEFRRALLAEQVERDLSARGLSAPFPAPGSNPEAEAAMQALALWLGEMREAKQDPAPVLAGLRP